MFETPWTHREPLLYIHQADFPFRIAIPEGLPPSIRLEKQSGISYEMVTSLCVKTKK